MTALGPLLYRIWGGGPGRKDTGAGVLGPTFLLRAQVRKGARHWGFYRYDYHTPNTLIH